jgi:hypothetical protein
MIINNLQNTDNGMIIANNDQPRMRVKKQLKYDRPSGHGFFWCPNCHAIRLSI